MLKQNLLTKGNVFSTLLRFSIPFLLANLLQALYGAADLMVIGQFSDSAGVSAVATGSQIMQTIASLFIGLTAGGTVIIGQYFGAGRKKELGEAMGTLLVFFFVLSLLTTGLILTLVSPICTLMQVPTESLVPTRQYLSVCAGGILFILGYNVLASIMRGLGDSKTPFLFIAVACVTNIVLDLLFVAVFHWGAAGAALATVAAQALSFLLCLFWLLKKGFFSEYLKGNLRFFCSHAKRFLCVGLPIAGQECFVNASFLMITALVNSMGLAASAAVGVVEKLIVFIMLPTTAFASAVAAMTAQHQGAGLKRRSYSCLRAGVLLALVFGVLCFVLAQVAPGRLIRLFSDDPLVVEQGISYLRSYSADCIVVCFVFCMNSFFCASGHAVFPLVHSLLTTFLVRLPLSALFRFAPSPMFSIGLAAPLASFLSLLLCLWYLRFLRRQPVYFALSSFRQSRRKV